MTLVELEQATRAWHEWRLDGVGASEVPIIMGESDWSTVYKLWEKKFHRIIDDSPPTWAQQRGIDAEPKIRALYELECGIDMPQATRVHPELPFFRASLDGYNENHRRVLEIKYPSAEKHRLAAEEKRVPTCYYGQVQAQLFVTGARACDYVSYDGQKIAIVSVEPDPVYIAKMIDAVTAFWERVKTGKAPEMGPDDVKELQDQRSELAFRRLVDAKVFLDQAKEQYEAAMEDVKSLMKDYSAISWKGVRLSRVFTKGNVDYSKIPELKGVDLEQYRKQGSFSVRPAFPKGTK